MEQKKLLWIIFSAVGFVFIVAAAGLILFWPKDKDIGAEGSVPSAGLKRDFDPVEWVREGDKYPGIDEDLVEETDTGEDVILVYGDNGETTEEKSPDSDESGSGETGAVEKGKDGVKKGTDSVVIETYDPMASDSLKGGTEKSGSQQEGEKKTAPQPAKTSRSTEYWIQVGSYNSMARAQEVKDTLFEKGVASIITTKTVDASDFYRVRIGPYGSKNEAEKFLGWIQGVNGYESSYVSMVYVNRNMN